MLAARLLGSPRCSSPLSEAALARRVRATSCRRWLPTTLALRAWLCASSPRHSQHVGCAAYQLAPLLEPTVGNSSGSSRMRLLAGRRWHPAVLALRAWLCASSPHRPQHVSCAATRLASPLEPAVGNSSGSSRARFLASMLAPHFSRPESVAVRVVASPPAACWLRGYSARLAARARCRKQLWLVACALPCVDAGTSLLSP
jgi:hypothetical protein